MRIIPNEGLGLALNDRGLPCRHCGLTHDYYTTHLPFVGGPAACLPILWTPSMAAPQDWIMALPEHGQQCLVLGRDGTPNFCVVYHFPPRQVLPGLHLAGPLGGL